MTISSRSSSLGGAENFIWISTFVGLESVVRLFKETMKLKESWGHRNLYRFDWSWEGTLGKVGNDGLLVFFDDTAFEKLILNWIEKSKQLIWMF